MAVASPTSGGPGVCFTRAHYSTLLKWHFGVPLLPADFAGRPCPQCGGPVDVFGDHFVSCKKSGLGYWHHGTPTVFCHVLTQSRVRMTSRWTSPETDAARRSFR